jgi:hypothetical protein
MRRRIAGSEADHRKRGYPIVSTLAARRRPRRSWLALIGSAVSAFLALYIGKPE